MPESLLQRVLHESLVDVLEKMFFISILDETPDTVTVPLEDDMTVRLSFDGKPSGSLTVRLNRFAARSIAADFLGAEPDELSDSQVGEVMCELANMICGSVLSRVEGAVTFRLGVPAIVAPEPLPATAAIYSVPLGPAAIMVAMVTEAPICPPAAEYAS
ncbi:MAG: chemotaxis protein CheX [Bryobacteraceae bacterium]